jgi:hypothetical protein
MGIEEMNPNKERRSILLHPGDGPVHDVSRGRLFIGERDHFLKTVGDVLLELEEDLVVVEEGRSVASLPQQIGQGRELRRHFFAPI